MKLIFELVVQDAKAAQAIEQLKINLRQINKELASAKDLEAFDRLTSEAVQTRVEIAKLIEQQKQLKKEFANASVPTDSLAGIRIEYSKLTDQIRLLTKAERESDSGQKLIANAKNIKKEILGIEESVGNFTGNVGNYKKALLSIGDIATSGLIFGGIERAVDLVTSAITRGAKEYASYEKALDNLSALTGLTGIELEKFKEKAKSLTTIRIGDFDIKNTSREIVEAFKIVGGAQPELLKSSDALAAVTKEAIVLSKASGIDLKDSVDSIVVTLGQFSLGASDANRITNELAAGAKAGSSEIQDTAKALKQFGTTAAVANVSTTESISLIQTLAAQQLKGSDAGTQLRNVLVRLSAAEVLPRNALAQLKQAGVDIDVLRNNVLPLETRLQELSKIAGNTAALVETFGVDNLNAAQIITQSVGRYKEFVKQISDTNEAYKQAEINSGNLLTAYENLKADGINAAIDGFETLSPILAFVINLFGSGLKFVITFFNTLRALPKFVQENKVEFTALAVGLALLNGQLILASLNNIRLAAATRIQAIATAATTLAQNALNAAMKANPVGLLITGISALALLFQAAYQRSEVFRASISGIGNVAFELFKIVSESFQAFSKGFSQIGSGDFSGALSSFGDAIQKSNPIGIALTQGQRLRNAFNTGYNNKIEQDKLTKNTQQTNDIQILSEKKKADQILDLNDKILDSNDKINKSSEDAAKKREDEIANQIKRIADLQKTIRDLDAGSITNDFDRQSVEIENKRAEALAKVSEARDALTQKIAQQKGVLSDADKQELALISEQTGSIIAAYNQQQDAVSENRELAIERQKQELSALALDVAKLAEDNAQRLAEAESEIANADFAQQRNELLAVLNERKKALSDQLLDGTISQERFKTEYLKEQEAFNVGTLALEKRRAEEVKAINDELENARLQSARAALAIRLAAIDTESEAEISAARKRATSEGGDAGALIDQIRLRAIQQRTEAEIEFDNTVRSATDANVQAQLDAAKTINDADAQVHADKLARLNQEKEKRRELRDAIIESTQTIAGAIFEIERNRIEAQLKTETETLDAEFAKRREAAQGNADQLAKLDIEYQKKKEALEKEAANKRKRVAITEAIIQGALGIVKALPNLVLAAVTAVATAAQVAVINSQSFAHGGITQFKKSGMFGGRYHAQGGTDGVFSDGTRVNVEKDEVFVILNRRASREIAGLSDLNYRTGGRRFEQGGSLDFTPQFAAPGEASGTIVVMARAEFSDEQVEIYADRIASKTSIQTRNAVAQGLDDRNRTAERQEILEANSEV